MNCVLFDKLIKFSVKRQNIKKNSGKWEKILEKSGNFVSPEKCVYFPIEVEFDFTT